MEQELKVNVKEIVEKLARIQKDMDYIREHIVDVSLTEDDINSLKEADKDLKQGKTRRL